MVLMMVTGLGGSVLLLGITIFQATLLAGCPGMPSVWQQLIFFDLLILLAGLAATRLAAGHGWTTGGRP